jgi:hypothetical protein
VTVRVMSSSDRMSRSSKFTPELKMPLLAMRSCRETSAGAAR